MRYFSRTIQAISLLWLIIEGSLGDFALKLDACNHGEMSLDLSLVK